MFVSKKDVQEIGNTNTLEPIVETRNELDFSKKVFTLLCIPSTNKKDQ